MFMAKYFIFKGKRFPSNICGRATVNFALSAAALSNAPCKATWFPREFVLASFIFRPCNSLSLLCQSAWRMPLATRPDSQFRVSQSPIPNPRQPMPAVILACPFCSLSGLGSCWLLWAVLGLLLGLSQWPSGGMSRRVAPLRLALSCRNSESGIRIRGTTTTRSCNLESGTAQNAADRWRMPIEAGRWRDECATNRLPSKTERKSHSADAHALRQLTVSVNHGDERITGNETAAPVAAAATK